MRFRLSTILLIATCLCILLAWKFDRMEEPNRLVNVWIFPNIDVQGSGYWETFEISADGTFSKRQSYRGHSELFKGTYTIGSNGIVNFFVDTKDYDLHGRNQPQQYIVWKSFQCRCAVDASDNLVIHPIDGDYGSIGEGGPADCNVIWKCYSSETALDKHRKQQFETFEEFMRQARETGG